MQVGILKEIKTKENRVSMTPAGVELLITHGHSVMVEPTAGRGDGSNFSDQVIISDAGAEFARPKRFLTALK